MEVTSTSVPARPDAPGMGRRRPELPGGDGPLRNRGGHRHGDLAGRVVRSGRQLPDLGLGAPGNWRRNGGSHAEQQWRRHPGSVYVQNEHFSAGRLVDSGVVERLHQLVDAVVGLSTFGGSEFVGADRPIMIRESLAET